MSDCSPCKHEAVPNVEQLSAGQTAGQTSKRLYERLGWLDRLLAPLIIVDMISERPFRFIEQADMREQLLSL